MELSMLEGRSECVVSTVNVGYIITLRPTCLRQTFPRRTQIYHSCHLALTHSGLGEKLSNNQEGSKLL